MANICWCNGGNGIRRPRYFCVQSRNRIESYNAKCYFNLGALHERKGNADAAKKCFANAIEIEESYSKAAIRLAALSESTGDIQSLLTARRYLVNEEGGKELLATLLVELAEGEAKILENTGGLPPTIPEGPALATEAVSLCEAEHSNHGTCFVSIKSAHRSCKDMESNDSNRQNQPCFGQALARSLNLQETIKPHKDVMKKRIYWLTLNLQTH